MNNLIRILQTLLGRMPRPSLDERYLAQAVDAHDLQARLWALERARP